MPCACIINFIYHKIPEVVCDIRPKLSCPGGVNPEPLDRHADCICSRRRILAVIANKVKQSSVPGHSMLCPYITSFTTNPLKDEAP